MIRIEPGPTRLVNRTDRRTVPATITLEKNRFFIEFGYDARLKDEVKALEGAKWHGFEEENPRKIWSVKDTPRNHFQLAWLTGKNPYAQYDADSSLHTFQARRAKFREHQTEVTKFFLTRRQCVLAGEMGIGKTLAGIEALEYLFTKIKNLRSLWVGPRGALNAVQYEFHKVWQSRVIPRWASYEEIKKIIVSPMDIDKCFNVIICDECSALKTWGSQRTQAMYELANFNREIYGDDFHILLMSGTPAPKDPSDWWSICEIACPGFIKESDPTRLKKRLGLMLPYEGIGGKYLKLKTWYDDPRKCFTCGELNDHINHKIENIGDSWYHDFKPSVNEISHLYERMKGLVLVKFLKDCATIPPKIYKIIECKPTPSTLRAASMITKTATSAIKTLTLLRELSDGFQYKEVETGKDQCPECFGKGKATIPVDLDDPYNPLDAESLAAGKRALYKEEDNTFLLIGFKEEKLRIGEQEIECPTCSGSGQVPHYDRQASRVDCPKDQAVIDLLEEYEELGRIVIWGGFTETVDRITELVVKQGWSVIRLDGRGWYSSGLGSDPQLLIERFQNKEYYITDDQGNKKYPKIAFVGNPGAGGKGLTLTAATAEVYYSNTFKGEDRSQSEARIHRIGSNGALIIDLVHLPQDLYVINNLKKKRDLQYMSMGVFQSELETYQERSD